MGSRKKSSFFNGPATKRGGHQEKNFFSASLRYHCYEQSRQFLVGGFWLPRPVVKSLTTRSDVRTFKILNLHSNFRTKKVCYKEKENHHSNAVCFSFRLVVSFFFPIVPTLSIKANHKCPKCVPKNLTPETARLFIVEG